VAVPTIEVETDDVVTISRLLEIATDPVAAAATRLANELARCGGMAGGDPAGRDWAAAYDRAAAAAFRASGDAINAVHKLAAMFAQTARNYAAADVASTAAVRRHVAADLATLPAPTTYLAPYCVPPSAAGGSGGGPFGWGLVEHAVGRVWPDGRPDRLRAAAAAWRYSATAFRDAYGDVQSACRSAAYDMLPEADDIQAVCAGLARQLGEIADAHGRLAAACEELAGHIEAMHDEVVDELQTLLAWTAGVEAGGALLSVLTFGGSVAGAQEAEAARVAAAGARIAQIIERFAALARTAAQAIAGVAERADRLAGELSGLLGMRLSTAVLEMVETAPLTLRARAAVAEYRLGIEAGNLPPLIIDGSQIEKKFKHAAVLGVTVKRGRAGFTEFEIAVRGFLHDRRTARLIVDYRGAPMIASYQVRTRVVVLQRLDGTFVSAWEARPKVMMHILRDRRLGGG
jgi:hypothetical protein